MQVGDNKSYDDINVTPMVDLYLVLLLIFIIMTTAGVQSVKVKLPSAGKPAESKEKPKMKAVTVRADGKIALDTTPVSSLSELERLIADARAKTPDINIVVKAEGEGRYQAVIDVLDVLGRLSISNIGLAFDAKK